MSDEVVTEEAPKEAPKEEVKAEKPKKGDKVEATGKAAHKVEQPVDNRTPKERMIDDEVVRYQALIDDARNRSSSIGSTGKAVMQERQVFVRFLKSIR